MQTARIESIVAANVANAKICVFGILLVIIKWNIEKHRIIELLIRLLRIKHLVFAYEKHFKGEILENRDYVTYI